MGERIYTIPVREIFETADGCPLCRLRNLLEERALDFVLGPAMMESDVRIETNRKGFCKDHLFKMAVRRSRLPMALILETHLDEVMKNIQKKKSRPDKHEMKSGQVAPHDCFVCERIAWSEQRMYANIAKLYSEQEDFRERFHAQPEICYLHYRELFAYSAPAVSGRRRREFEDAVDRLTLQGLQALRQELHHFTEMFDYRNSGENADFGTARDAIERTIGLLTSRNPENDR